MEMLGPARTARVDGVDVSYRELGEGAPVVMLHGLADSHRTFRRVAPALARRHRVLLVDLPGHGWSARPADAPYTAAWYADCVAGVMESAGVERAALCGHSFGGGVALSMLRDHGAKVDRLALVAPGGLGREVCLWLRLASLPVARSLLGSAALRKLATDLAIRLGPARFAMPEREEMEIFHAIAQMPGTAEALARTIEACLDVRGQRASFWEEAKGIGRLPPIAIFWGKRDPVVPFAHGPCAAARLMHASLHAYERAGHFPHLDEPDRFVGDLSEFLGDASRKCCRLQDVAVVEGWFARLSAERARVARTAA